MDSNQFRKQTKPNYGPKINHSVLETAVKRVEAPLKETESIADPRYPQYASKMSDGRLLTDYKPHCAANTAPSRYGNSMRAWFQHHADAIVQVSRQRQVERTGAQYMRAATVPDAKQIQKCDEYECKFLTSRKPHTIGLERKEGVPELFGTFGEPTRMTPQSGEALTTNFEGGRNTPRGRAFQAMGTGSAFA
jgi:hypothetical protein